MFSFCLLVGKHDEARNSYCNVDVNKWCCCLKYCHESYDKVSMPVIEEQNMQM